MLKFSVSKNCCIAIETAHQTRGVRIEGNEPIIDRHDPKATLTIVGSPSKTYRSLTVNEAGGDAVLYSPRWVRQWRVTTVDANSAAMGQFFIVLIIIIVTNSFHTRMKLTHGNNND